MFLFQKSNTKSSSRRHIAIKAVQDGILQLPGYEYRLLLEVSSVNFELRSEAEQDALIDTYQQFLHSLAWGIRILVQFANSISILASIADFRSQIKTETELVYKAQIERYTTFVSSLSSANKILSRRFFVVVPYQCPV